MTVPPTAASKTPNRDRRRATAIGLELLTGAAGIAGGIALAAEPDGSLLQAKLSALHNSPFTSWQIPGLLLATLAGGGFLLAGLSELARWRRARHLSLLAGAGLVAFEGAELAWIGFQPLEAVFAGVGIAIILLRRTRPDAARSKARRAHPAHRYGQPQASR